LKSGKASTFLLALNNVWKTAGANGKDRTAGAKAGTRLTFRLSIPQSRIRAPAPFTQGSLWQTPYTVRLGWGRRAQRPGAASGRKGHGAEHAPGKSKRPQKT